MRLNEAIQRFKDHSSIERSEATTRGYMGDLLQFCRYMRNPLITQITPEHITAYLNESLQLGWKKNALMPVSIALRKFFEYWKRKGYPVLDYQMLPIVPREGVQPRVATRDNVDKILEVCSSPDIYSVRNKAIILLLMDTGMRNGELCSMNITDLEKVEIDGPQFSCVIKTEKNKTTPHRRVFWYGEANDALNQWLLLRSEYVRMFPPKDDNAVFIGTQGNTPHRMTPYTVGLMFRKLSQQVGIPTLNPHSLRHLFGMEAAVAGANNSNISDLMGHASLTSSFVYTHLKGKELGDVHKKVKKLQKDKDVV